MIKHQKARIGWQEKIKVKMGPKDAHYSGGLVARTRGGKTYFVRQPPLVAGAKILELFGDAATKLCLRETGGKNEGLFRAYQGVDFLKPVYAGDTVVATATIIKVGTTSRQMKFVATNHKKVIVAKALGTVVIPQILPL